MARATSCKLNGKEIDVSEALDLRDQTRAKRLRDPDFRCIECGKPVRPHNEGSQGGAHIEHHARNERCSLSDPVRTS
jgi:hypothetical protein